MSSQEIKTYLSKIGRTGGKKSRKSLSSDFAKKMVLLREAKRAYKKYYALCFWSYDPALKLSFSDSKWVGEQLMKYGNREIWKIGQKLCR